MFKRSGREWLVLLLIGLAPMTVLASGGPMPNSAFNLQGGTGAWQLEASELLYRSDFGTTRYRDIDNTDRSNLDLRVGADLGLTERVQIGGTLPFRTALGETEALGRGIRGDLRVLLSSSGGEATSLAMWGAILEGRRREEVLSGQSEYGVQYNWSRREETTDIHFGVGTEQVDYPEGRDIWQSDSRYYLQAGLVERLSNEHAMTLEFEFGRTYDGDRRTFLFRPGLRWYQPNTDLVWTGQIGLAPDAVPGRPSFTARIGLTYLLGARGSPDDRRIRRLEAIAEDHEQRITGVEDWVSRQPGAPEPEPEKPEFISIIIQDTMGDEQRAEAWGRRFEEWGNYRLERVDYVEVEDEPSSSTIYYGPDTADEAVELGRRIPTGFQEVLRNEEISEPGVIWLYMGRDLERYPESFDAL